MWKQTIGPGNIHPVPWRIYWFDPPRRSIPPKFPIFYSYFTLKILACLRTATPLEISNNFPLGGVVVDIFFNNTLFSPS